MGKNLSDTLKKMSKEEKRKFFSLLLIVIVIAIIVSLSVFLIFSNIVNSKSVKTDNDWADIYENSLWVYSSGEKILGDRIEFVDRTLVRSYVGSGYTEYELKTLEENKFLVDSYSFHFSVNPDGAYLLTLENFNEKDKFGYYKKEQ